MNQSSLPYVVTGGIAPSSVVVEYRWLHWYTFPAPSAVTASAKLGPTGIRPHSRETSTAVATPTSPSKIARVRMTFECLTTASPHTMFLLTVRGADRPAWQACKQSMSGEALEMRRGGSVRGPPTLPGVPAKGRACAFGPRSPSHPSTQGWRLHTNPGPSPPPGAQFGLCAVSISNMGRTAKRRSCAYKQRYANKRGASKGREKPHAPKLLRPISIFIPLVSFPFSLFLKASTTLTHRDTRYLQPPPFAQLAAGCGSCSRPRGGGARPQAILQAYRTYGQMIGDCRLHRPPAGRAELLDRR